MIYFKPLQEDDLRVLYEWFQEPTINQLYARGQSWSLKDIENKYLSRLREQDNVPSFIVYQNIIPKVFKRKTPYLKAIIQIKLWALTYLLLIMKIGDKGLA